MFGLELSAILLIGAIAAAIAVAMGIYFYLKSPLPVVSSSSLIVQASHASSTYSFTSLLQWAFPFLFASEKAPSQPLASQSSAQRPASGILTLEEFEEQLRLNKLVAGLNKKTAVLHVAQDDQDDDVDVISSNPIETDDTLQFFLELEGKVEVKVEGSNNEPEISLSSECTLQEIITAREALPIKKLERQYQTKNYKACVNNLCTFSFEKVPVPPLRSSNSHSPQQQ